MEQISSKLKPEFKIFDYFELDKYIINIDIKNSE